MIKDVDELACARIQLEQLREKERDLHEELSRVRAEIDTHRWKMEHLARAKVPINFLPSEILSYVVELAVFPAEYSYQHRILALSRVSRSWRDIILNSPKFWNHIAFDSCTNMSLVRACVARSCQYPLDIGIRCCGVDALLSTFIDAIVPHVHRWRTLKIDETSRQSLELTLNKINHLKFPSLTHTTIATIQDLQYPSFLRPENSPSLQVLDLDNLVPMNEFLPGQGFTDISLYFSSGPFGPLAFSSLLSSHHLTTLKLAYSACPSLQPDSIPLPLLTSLTLEAEHPRVLISAIVAPRLSYFDLIYQGSMDQLSDLFYSLKPKFRDVHHFRFHIDGSISTADAELISSVFPNLRHVELHTTKVDDFFRTAIDGSESCPADNWESLESLTFNEMTIYHATSSNSHFVRWLRGWNLEGLPMLRVKFFHCAFLSTDDDDDDERSEFSTPESLSRLHGVLRKICTLDIVSAEVQAMAIISLTSASPPPLHLSQLYDS